MFSPGNRGEEGEEVENGLFGSLKNSRFAISTRLDKPLVSLKDISLQFDVRKEDKTTESEATIKLFGDEGHSGVAYHYHHQLSKEEHTEAHKIFSPLELQLGSPYLVEFGPLFFDYLSLIVVKIRSQDGGEWVLKNLLDPVNTKSHTYRLILTQEGGYQVSVDKKTVAAGMV